MLPQDPRFIPAVLSAEECRALIELSESLVYEPATLHGADTGPHGFRTTGGRDNARSATEDPTIAELIGSRVLKDMPPQQACSVAGLNERLRFYRYDAGQSFPPHTDGFYEDARGRSLLTLLLYLNDDFAGGETHFTESNRTFRAQTGAALLFAHDLWHEGRPLKSGRKYVLRTDVIFKTATSLS